MSEFLLSVHSLPNQPPPSESAMAGMYADVEALNTALRSAGAWVFAGGLTPADTARVVHANGGDVAVTYGVRTTGPETLGGFWIIDVDSIDVAQEWAERASRACAGPVEVRPFQSHEAD